VRYIVELSNDSVQKLGSGETVLSLDLRTEMSEDDDGGHVGSYENRSNQKLEVGKPFRVAVKWLIDQNLVSHQVCLDPTHLGSLLSNSKMTKSV
jgi:hypothetical protein